MAAGSWILLNGNLVAEDTAAVTTDNRAFLYGDSLFETIRISRGNIQFLEDHLERLTAGAALLRYQLPSGFSVESLRSSVQELLLKNGHTPEARVRLTLYRNTGGRYIPAVNEASWLIQTEKLEGEGYVLNAEGLRVAIFEGLRKSPDALAQFKTGSAILYVLAALYAKENGLDDSLLMNTNDRVIEATGSNIILVKGTHLHTPSIAEGPVAGVMRRQIIKLAVQKGYGISSGRITRETLLEAEEIWLTNAIHGIRWVGGLDGRTFGNKAAGRFLPYINELSA